MNVVHFFKLTPDVRAGIQRYSDGLGVDPAVDTVDMHRVWWELNDFCGLWFRLRYENDTAHIFPRGKWDTLRIMELMIESAVKHPVEMLDTSKHARGNTP